MSVTVVSEDILEQAEYELAIRELRKRKAQEHPAFLLHFAHCIDAKSGEEFDFDLLTAEEREEIDVGGEPGGWFWHRDVLNSWLIQVLSLELKARQIGITWLAAGLALWTALMTGGTRVLILSTNEEEAKKVIARIWGMYQSLPRWLTEHVAVTKPARGGNPSQEIEFTHHGTLKRSTILALPATESAGHGETAALVILDEYSRQDFAKSIWKGTFPVIDGGGRIVIISTANGVSNEQTGEGNFFHYLWVNALSMGIVRRFLGWFMHPGRDQQWYDVTAAALPPTDRAEQYPQTPEDAFINTGQCWFDLQKLNAYQQRWRDTGMKMLRRIRFVEQHLQAKIIETSSGEWRIYVEPLVGRKYGICGDPATGRGTDFSSAHIIDLETAEWVAEFHAKLEADEFAMNLYYAGRWYNDAMIAVENQGGYGDAVIIPLRDGAKGRRPYKNMYRHTKQENIPDFDESPGYGYPMTPANRPLLINQLEQWIREGLLPWITPELDGELRTFSRAKTMPSPRAQEGCNDDRVLSAMGSLELFRQFGSRKLVGRRERPKSKSRWRESQYPWEG